MYPRPDPGVPKTPESGESRVPSLRGRTARGSDTNERPPGRQDPRASVGGGVEATRIGATPEAPSRLGCYSETDPGFRQSLYETLDPRPVVADVTVAGHLRQFRGAYTETLATNLDADVDGLGTDPAGSSRPGPSPLWVRPSLETPGFPRGPRVGNGTKTGVPGIFSRSSLIEPTKRRLKTVHSDLCGNLDGSRLGSDGRGPRT